MFARCAARRNIITSVPKPSQLGRARDLYTFGLLTGDGVGRVEKGTRFDEEWAMFYTTNATTNPTLMGLRATDVSIDMPTDPSPSAMLKAMEAMHKDFNVSPWHGFLAKPPVAQNSTKHTATAGSNLYTYVNEIPHGTREKIEMKPKEAFNPLRQDRFKKDNSLRSFKYGKMPFNYGFIPRTFEDPTVCDPHLKMDGVLGDGDPIDVVELSTAAVGKGGLDTGDVTVVRVLGVLALLDEGECDWKVITQRVSASAADCREISVYKSLKDVPQSRIDQIVDWFRNYKTADGKPQNEFGFEGKVLDEAFAMDVIETTRAQYDALRAGTSGANGKGFWVPEMEKW